MKEKEFAWLKGMIVALVLSGILAVVFSYIMYWKEMDWSWLGSATLAIYILSSLVGGMIFSKSFRSKNFLSGGIFGILYFVFLMLAGVIWNGGVFPTFSGMLTGVLICAFAGMLGGMVEAVKK